MNNREWRPVVGYEDCYSISNDGIVVRTKYYDSGNNGKYELPYEISQRYDKDGYKKVTLTDGEAKSYFVHRLVAQAFIDNPNNKAQVNHKNGVKDDNRIENLEWATASENIRHRIDVLGVSLRNQKGSKVVIQKDMAGNEIARFPSAKEAHRVTGYSQGHISECCRNEITQYKGFIWQYENTYTKCQTTNS